MRNSEPNVHAEDNHHTAKTWGDFMPAKDQWSADAGGKLINHR
jgi:hypothetical protein